METLTVPRQSSSSSAPPESPLSAVSWGAVGAGAFVIAAMSLALLALGAGFGLSILSPWTDLSENASAAGTTAIVWMIVGQVVASILGGYMVGRLRTRWTAVHNDEVFFRDTANGFLAWAVAVVICASFLATAATSMLSSSLARPTVVAAASNPVDPNAYYVDTLFRSETNTPGPLNTPPAEATRVFTKALLDGQMKAEDKRYLGRIVAARTEIAPEEAERRIDLVLTDARQATDSVRKVTAHLLLWTFLALLMGAFSASYSATLGGRLRDRMKAIG
jgi:hypothetical protein